MDEALSEESGDEQKCRAGEDLGSDKRASQEAATSRARGAAHALKGLLGFNAEDAESGEHTEDEGCSDG